MSGKVRSARRKWFSFWKPSVSVTVKVKRDTSGQLSTPTHVWQVTFNPIILLTSGTAPSVHLRDSLWVSSLRHQGRVSVWSPGPVQSDWAVYGSAVLWCLWTCPGLGFEWCVRERNRNRERQRDSKCTFLLQCIRSRERESKQQQKLRRKTIWLFNISSLIFCFFLHLITLISVSTVQSYIYILYYIWHIDLAAVSSCFLSHTLRHKLKYFSYISVVSLHATAPNQRHLAVAIFALLLVLFSLFGGGMQNGAIII